MSRRDFITLLGGAAADDGRKKAWAHILKGS
jgi:hypothetical protein